MICDRSFFYVLQYVPSLDCWNVIERTLYGPADAQDFVCATTRLRTVADLIIKGLRERSTERGAQSIYLSTRPAREEGAAA